MPTISPTQAQALLAQGAVLIDIRDPDEHARTRIAGAINQPLATLNAAALPAGRTCIFHCRSGQRTKLHAQRLHALGAEAGHVLEGGLDAWQRAGLPVVHDTSQPLELMRQVQIAAGSMVLTGSLLGATVSPWWHGLAGCVGAGLVFAGVSGFCGLARVLARMPWNRRAAAH